ncbi:TolC family protein [Oxalicibacterium solurbis]|nr:TolC family protein [Oxalicibacterium solurbis]
MKWEVTRMRQNKKLRRYVGIPLMLSMLILGGCASFSQDGGFDSVSALTKERSGQSVQKIASPDAEDAARAKVRELLATPLTPDTAVQIALLNNKGLQASFAELGIAEADYVQAGRMRNPGFSFGRLGNGSDAEIDRSVMFDLIGLLTIPVRSGIEQRRFEQTKLQTAKEAIMLAGETRRAYFNAVSAAQTAQYMQQVQQAAEAGAELAQRMARVGNWSKLDQAREQAFYADATAQVARARHNAVAAREKLNRLLGVWGSGLTYELPDRLPDLPSSVVEAGNIEQKALEQRLDVQIAKGDAVATARALGLTKATRFMNVLDVGYINKSEAGMPRENGYEISLELPIFDFGGARTAKAEAIYMQSVNRTADIAIRARSEVREAYSGYRTSYDIAKHYRDEVIPLRQKISDEVMLRYNGMLVSVFELLTDAREQISNVNAAIEAQRDFWIAETDLQAAMNVGGADNGSSMQVASGGAPSAAAHD